MQACPSRPSFSLKETWWTLLCTHYSLKLFLAKSSIHHWMIAYFIPLLCIALRSTHDRTCIRRLVVVDNSGGCKLFHVSFWVFPEQHRSCCWMLWSPFHRCFSAVLLYSLVALRANIPLQFNWFKCNTAVLKGEIDMISTQMHHLFWIFCAIGVNLLIGNVKRALEWTIQRQNLVQRFNGCKSVKWLHSCLVDMKPYPTIHGIHWIHWLIIIV